MNINIREMMKNDWDAVKYIYQAGIYTGNSTFQIRAPDWEEWNSGHMEKCRYVACTDNDIVGWIALSPYSGRNAYRGVAEISVYVNPQHFNMGIGRILLANLIDESEKVGIWTLVSGIFPENEASIKLHTSQGFRKVGYREKVGEMNGEWRDVLIFEKRSKIVHY